MGHVELWRWNHITNVWDKVPAVVTTVRMVAAGQVAAGAHKLHWVDCNPSAGNSVWALTDAIAALGAIVLDEFHTARNSHCINLSPPMDFSVGIYLETFTNMTSVTFGFT